MRSPFRLSVATALRNGETQTHSVHGLIDDLFVSGSEVPEGAEVEVEATIIPVGRTIEVAATVRAPWQGDCRRCLQPASGIVRGEVREIFEERPVEGETYPLVHDEIDLEPLARETVVLELPQAPLCREDCLGLCPQCGADRNEGGCSCDPPTDPRWAALDGLRDTD